MNYETKTKQVVVGTKVGRTKHTRIMPGGALETEQSLSSSVATGPSSVFVGKKLDEHRGAFLLEYPMDKGHILDGGWDAMEALWEVRTTHNSHVYMYMYAFMHAYLILRVANFFWCIDFMNPQ